MQWHRKKRKPRPEAVVRAEIESLRPQFEIYQRYTSYNEASRNFENGVIARIEEKILSIERDRRSYESRFGGILRTGKLTAAAMADLQRLHRERAERRRIFEIENKPVKPPTNLNGREMISDYGTKWESLRRELEEATRIGVREQKKQSQRAIVADVNGTARDLASELRRKLPFNHPCPYCGNDLGDTPHADHIYPLSKGGRSVLQNMVFVCARCNQNKTAKTLNAFIVEFGLDREVVFHRLKLLGKDF